MNNYFSNTPIYKIWIDFIDYLSPRTSFLIDAFHYKFVSIVCRREEVVCTYISNVSKVEMVYAHENRKFYCRVVNSQTDDIINWINLPPTSTTVLNNFSDLQREIDLWLGFLKTEL